MAGCRSAQATCSGENKSDCGSAIIGQPAKTFGVHHGHSAREIEVAKNCRAGKNCDFASHGIVTAPESQGQDNATKASANIAIVTKSDWRGLTRPSPQSLSAGERERTEFVPQLFGQTKMTVLAGTHRSAPLSWRKLRLERWKWHPCCRGSAASF